MTVHQAKGRQWPAVFIPCLRKNRFPSRKHGGLSTWHVLPASCVLHSERFTGTDEDERRLFYVALTRAEKYLFCSWSPVEDNRQLRKQSKFLSEFAQSDYVLTKEPESSRLEKRSPLPRKQTPPLTLTFSELRYYFECPYSFKIRFLYGFNPPIVQELGYGKSLHNALTEIHAESLEGRIPSNEDYKHLSEDLIEKHLHLPYASDDRLETLRRTARTALEQYLQDQGENLHRLEHVEKGIEIKLDDGIVVNGRIDLIRTTDTDEWIIVDFKTRESSQDKEISKKQLNIYAAGFQQLTGRLVDLIEIYNMDGSKPTRESIEAVTIEKTLEDVVLAGKRLRVNTLPRLPRWCPTCKQCDMVGICRTRQG